ncbi:uncharacterized protein LOC105181263 [Harpegnathos saltator]|uniref:uncharacterized protein LOC105181263 n=1 Tax=Harpegnathos saltator TaxID=610380 RepID=UPI0005910A54|nr:uncharacterized protein LOC105181263 [Harpegnathos saltator]
MSITSRMLYNKLCGLRPDLSSRITPEILSEICDDPNTQPFLKWFFENVHFTNVLSSEEIILKNTLSDESNEWLEDEVLDAALEEATRDCPELLHLVDLDDTYKEDLFEEYEILKDCYKEDKEYLNSLKHSIINLKEVDNRLDDDIEEAETLLHKEQIETEKLYENCSVVLKEFDRDNCQFSKDVDSLLNIYANATKNQGDTVLWSQMPIDLFIKQVELYNHYLGIHIRKQFESVNKEEQDEDSDYASLINNSREKQVDERMHELISCKTNLRNSKIEEINADIQVESYIAMLQSIRDIYNSGILKVPGNNEIDDEILTLSTKRDILEQNVELLRDQQFSVIAQFAEIETIKILKNDALARLERRKTRLEKLKNLYYLAGEHGHVYVDLLYILMEMQYRNLCEVVEFIADARHYITTEYKLSSTRCEVMQQQQDEYATILMESSKTCNIFNQIFTSMMAGDCSDLSFSSALKKYDDLITENAEKKLMLETFLNNKISMVQKLANKVNKDYMAETQYEPTNSFKPISYEISTNYEEISANVQELQADVTKIRNQFKERMKADASFEREKDILWQRFLADPDTLKMKYEEAKQRVDDSHFGDTVESKPSF